METKDKLKDFIQDNLEEFDTSMPSASLWDKIEAEKKHDVPKQKLIKLNVEWYKVAAAILLISNVYFAFLLTNKETKQVATVIEDPQIEEVQQGHVSPLYTEFTAVELVYQSKVNSKVQELKKYQTKFPEVNQEVETELKELSNDFNELKKELNNEVMDEVIIQAMVENYQIRLQILEDILAQIDTYNNKNRTHEINI